MDLVAGRRRAGFLGRVRELDPILLACVASLVGIGLLAIYSATNRTLAALGLDPATYLKRQAVFAVIAAILLIVAAGTDYRFLKVYAPIFYGGAAALLILVQTPLGTTVKGSQRWFQVAGFQFTPSEASKVALMAMLASMFADLRGREPDLRDVIRASAVAALPGALVFLQPDLGTSIVLAAILAGILFAAGAKPRHLGVLLATASVLFFGALQLGLIQEYQVNRLTSFLDPENDPLRSGYNRKQAEIAIGAGGVVGLGYLRGTQTNLDFVPEQHTDFIFTVVGEEFGFVGSVALVGLFAVLVWRAFRVAMASKDPFGGYLASGIGTYFMLQIFVNVGMTIGIMPITGIPLPFVSYGGTAMLVNGFLAGTLLSIEFRRLP
ncbi:MAG: rod shape-determining protein RodA [Actinomycetota bacterium]